MSYSYSAKKLLVCEAQIARTHNTRSDVDADTQKRFVVTRLKTRGLRREKSAKAVLPSAALYAGEPLIRKDVPRGVTLLCGGITRVNAFQFER